MFPGGGTRTTPTRVKNLHTILFTACVTVFATHLLKKGADIRYIKDSLGHFNIKTLERYLYVSKKELINISGPLEDLFKKGKIYW